MLKITITNGKEDYNLYFNVRDTDIAKKWLNEVQKNYCLDAIDRFTNWGYKNIINELNEKIDHINSYEKLINYKVDKNTKQKDLNYLHKFFEDLKGGEGNSEWYNNAPDDIQHSISKLNILIHELESQIRKSDHPTIVVTYKNPPLLKLTDKDVKHFTFKWSHGTIYINYPHVGKPILDVFKDRDSIAEVILPQSHYSADFMIKFGPSVSTLHFFARKILIKFWLCFQKFNFENLNLGMIPVADINHNVELEYLYKFDRIKDVCVI